MAESTRVRIVYRDLYLEKPPKVRLYFDIELANHGDEPRWFLLPLLAGTEDQEGPWCAEELACYVLGANGRTTIGVFSGERGFRALLLPGGGEAQLRDYPILVWGEIPSAVTLEAAVAVQMRIWGQEAARWFDGDPTCLPHTDVSCEALAQEREVYARRRAPPGAPCVVTLSDPQRIQTTLEVL
jgi:hypothetical protein